MIPVKVFRFLTVLTGVVWALQIVVQIMNPRYLLPLEINYVLFAVMVASIVVGWGIKPRSGSAEQDVINAIPEMFTVYDLPKLDPKFTVTVIPDYDHRIDDLSDDDLRWFVENGATWVTEAVELRSQIKAREAEIMLEDLGPGEVQKGLMYDPYDASRSKPVVEKRTVRPYKQEIGLGNIDNISDIPKTPYATD